MAWREKTTWRELIEEELGERGEAWADIEGITLSDEQLAAKFDAGYGGSEGAPFTAWTAKRVYFPAVYDGAEWCASVPRHPCDEATGHVGGQ